MIEEAIEDVKSQPEIHLGSTARYVMPDPEDVESIYDTCDTVGPWHGLDDKQRLTVLEDLEWDGVHPDDKREIIAREVDLLRVDPEDRARALGDMEPWDVDEFLSAPRRSDRFYAELESVRQTTSDLIHSVMADAWPRPGAIVDFGLNSQEHYEALYHPIRAHEIMPSQLDAALGNGEALTWLARTARSNPHKDVEFSTSWDAVFMRGRFAPAHGEGPDPGSPDCEPEP
jgi:hypothetical protein